MDSTQHVARVAGNAPPMSEAVFINVERTLARSLTMWSAISAVVGASAWAIGRRSGNQQVTAFGRQTLAWAAIDGLIAAGATRARRRRAPLSDQQVQEKARSLHRVLLINIAAEIGYVAGGLVVVAKTSDGRRAFRLRRGDGVAIVSQSAFLLALDTSQVVRLRT